MIIGEILIKKIRNKTPSIFLSPKFMFYSTDTKLGLLNLTLMS